MNPEGFMRTWLGSLVVLPALFSCAAPEPTTAPNDLLLTQAVSAGGHKCDVVTVTPESATIPIGGQVDLEATLLNKKGNSIPSATAAWTTRNVNVAAVSSSGLVTGVGTGSTYVVADCAPAYGDSAFITVSP